MTDLVTEIAPDEQPPTSPRREPAFVEGLDRSLAAAFFVIPLVLGPLMAFVLSLGFDLVTYVVLTVLVGIMVRSVVWHVRSMMVAGPRSSLYLERRDASANTSFLAGLLIGLAIYDIAPLPAGPFWSAQQPRASFTLLAVIVYLVWVAQYARIPVEVREGWKRLLGR